LQLIIFVFLKSPSKKAKGIHQKQYNKNEKSHDDDLKKYQLISKETEKNE
jgi:hypothetical protein